MEIPEYFFFNLMFKKNILPPFGRKSLDCPSSPLVKQVWSANHVQLNTAHLHYEPWEMPSDTTRKGQRNAAAKNDFVMMNMTKQLRAVTHWSQTPDRQCPEVHGEEQRRTG